MLPPYSHLVLSDLNIESGWDEICDIDPEEPRICGLVAEATEMLEEDWASDDEDSDFNIIKDDDEPFGSNFFDENIVDDEPSQEQLDYMDFDLERDDYLTWVSPVSSETLPYIADHKYH
jgi:hypothetical protein